MQIRYQHKYHKYHLIKTRCPNSISLVVVINYLLLWTNSLDKQFKRSSRFLGSGFQRVQFMVPSTLCVWSEVRQSSVAGSTWCRKATGLLETSKQKTRRGQVPVCSSGTYATSQKCHHWGSILGRDPWDPNHDTSAVLTLWHTAPPTMAVSKFIYQ